MSGDVRVSFRAGDMSWPSEVEDTRGEVIHLAGPEQPWETTKLQATPVAVDTW